MAGEELTVGEVERRLRVSDSTVRKYIDDHLLRAWWTDGGHRRIESTSVDELQQVLATPPGPARDQAREELRARNQEWLRRRTGTA